MRNLWNVVVADWWIPRDDEDGVLDHQWGVRATGPTGRRFTYVGPVPTRSYGEAEALVARIDACRAVFPGWSPADRPRYWQEIDPVYGSEEYVRQGVELDRLYAERMAEGWEFCAS